MFCSRQCSSRKQASSYRWLHLTITVRHKIHMDAFAQQTQQHAAAGAVSALYFACFVGSSINTRLTGFKLYIPVAAAALVRGVSFACRSGYYATWNNNLIAAHRATQAVGLGLSIALCACFLIIWLRNAQPNHQPAKLSSLLTILCKVSVALVIVLGPLLMIISTGIANSKPGNAQAMQQGMQVRKASVTGFVVVAGLVAFLVGCSALIWIIGAMQASHHKQHNPQQQQQRCDLESQQQQQQLSHHDQQTKAASSQAAGIFTQNDDKLILLLFFSAVLLTWSAAALVASIDHANLLNDVNLYYPVMVLPELVVAVLWALPFVVARMVLGSRFHAWKQQQQQERENGSRIALPAQTDANVKGTVV